jgi:2-alkyl-3-oxoalkanoate reductase
MPQEGPQGLALVTGANGFLGGRLLERLISLRRPVAALVRAPRPDLEERGVRVVVGDLLDPSTLRAASAGAETVFHVASKVGVWGPEAEFHRVNVEGLERVLDACREQRVRRLVYTSTPSVVFNGEHIAGGNESMPYGRDFPSPYPATKAVAERMVLAADRPNGLRSLALRPHLIWGPGDRYLIPRVLERARAGRLRIIGAGNNRVDLTDVENVVDAHLLAERSLAAVDTQAGGRAYFISNGEPVVLWDWINELLGRLDLPPVTRRAPLGVAVAAGAACEAVWRLFRLKGEPPITRFVAAELAKDHWFDISAARRDLGYQPKVSMAAGMDELVASLKRPA